MGPRRWPVSTMLAAKLLWATSIVPAVVRSSSPENRDLLAPGLELSSSADDSSQLMGDHPVLEVELRPQDINRCSNFDLSKFYMGRSCGSPISKPCFDLSRCQDGLTIYVHDFECSLADSASLVATYEDTDNPRLQSSYWRNATLEAGLLADSYEEACVVIHVNTHMRSTPCATSAPRWNGGANHVMMDFTDLSRDHRSAVSNSYAMEWASSTHACYYRTGYDLSLPLFPMVVFPELAHVAPGDRKYFLTFKGTLYLSGHGVEERSAAAGLHDEANGVISVVKCFDLHDEQLLPQYYDYCLEAGRMYEANDYTRLMNTTFGLVPGGRSPGTYRLGEVMSAGAIPVFVVRDWIRPFREKFDWPAFSFIFTPEEVGPAMMQTLRDVPPEKLIEMQDASLKAYERIFGGATNFSTIARNSIEELSQRLAFH